MGLIGPNLELVNKVDPADGHFEVAWIAANQREEWRNYLKLLRRGCREVLLRYVDAPTHIDGKVFRTAETPVAVRTQSETLSLLDFLS
jgi:hypothetical protein